MFLLLKGNKDLWKDKKPETQEMFVIPLRHIRSIHTEEDIVRVCLEKTFFRPTELPYDIVSTDDFNILAPQLYDYTKNSAEKTTKHEGEDLGIE